MKGMVNRVAFAALNAANLAAACSLITPEHEEATLHFVIDDYHGELLTWDDELVEVHQSLDDAVGLAGIEIEVSGIGQTRTLSGADFRPSFFGYMRTEDIDVPVSGDVGVIVKVRQGDDVVVEGAMSWNLEPNIAWWMLISRAQYPPND